MPDDSPARATARETIALLTGAAGFTEHRPPSHPLPPDGPLGWAGYDAARERAGTRTGEEESVVYAPGSSATARACCSPSNSVSWAARWAG